MINLFNINSYVVDTSSFKNLLHGDIVCEFEQAFAEYVGAKHACFANSASSLLFLSLLKYKTTIRLPSTIPPVVPNVVINTGNKIQFYDDISWVGGVYHLHENIFDSAQEVSKNQYRDYANEEALVIFSFYPTKPVGGCDGGMIVSNNRDEIDWYRMMVLNGMNYSSNNWERKQIAAGYKMHGNSIQAYVAYENLKKLEHKNNRLDEIRGHYNDELGYSNTSRHLYRIRVDNNSQFIDMMKQEGIVCGVHYRHCHDRDFYGFGDPLPASEIESEQTVSLPFHEKLSKSERNKVIANVRNLANI
jgi:dTDP-4-amino-4,6-dideoxygalactose transaminase